MIEFLASVFKVCNGEKGFLSMGGGNFIDDSLNLVGLGFFDEGVPKEIL